jgi:tetratricopeptide (TPR) repeat protein
MLERLASPLRLLTAGARDLPARQQTLRAAIGWSFDLLGEPERALFARLGVFAGGFDLAAVEAVCEGECGPDPLETLSCLVSESLVRQEADADGQPRFSMLETIREYALEKLGAGGEAEAVRRRHALHFLALAEEAEPGLKGRGQRAWVERLDREHDNLRAAMRFALDRGEPALAVRIGWSLWVFWWIRGHQAEGRRWMDAALDGEALEPGLRARALWTAGTMAFVAGDHEAAASWAAASLAAAREAGDAPLEALALMGNGAVALLLGDGEGAASRLEASLALFRRLGDGWGAAQVLHNLGRLASLRGDLGAAVSALEEAAALLREAGDWSSLVLVLHNLALAVLLGGDPSARRPCCARGSP